MTGTVALDALMVWLATTVPAGAVVSETAASATPGTENPTNKTAPRSVERTGNAYTPPPAAAGIFLSILFYHNYFLNPHASLRQHRMHVMVPCGAIAQHKSYQQLPFDRPRLRLLSASRRSPLLPQGWSIHYGYGDYYAGAIFDNSGEKRVRPFMVCLIGKKSGDLY